MNLRQILTAPNQLTLLRMIFLPFIVINVVGHHYVWALVLFAVAVYSVFAGGKGHVVEVGLSIASVAYGALLGVFLLGTLTRYATQGGAIVGMICGFGVNLLLWLDPNPIALGSVTIPHIAFTWYVLIGTSATFLTGLAASFLIKETNPRANS